ncbi:TPA: DUF1642 domain-containing protein [Enterococcus faecium]|nr:DUF1642 domain-containing protein [Enterococcus faecium]
MNKQEAIKKLESIKTIGNDARAACYNEGINAGITIIKQLDEPQPAQQPVVPQSIALLIENYKEGGVQLSDILVCFNAWSESEEGDYRDEISWLVANPETFMRAWLDGYEVEKVLKYIVKIGKLYLKEPLGDTSNSTILTTWDKNCAYPFSNFHMADKHAAKFEGAVEEVVEE